jgi:hypothetical protein
MRAPSPSPAQRGLVVAGLIVSLAGFGCTSPDATAPRAPVPGAALRQVMADPGFIVACKKGGTAGTYHFHLDVQGGGDFTDVGGRDVTVDFDGTNMSCVTMVVSSNEASWTGKTATITVSEVQIPTGMHVDSIEVYNSLTGGYDATLTNTSSATRQFTYGDMIWTKFYNSPAADCGTACATGRMTGGGATVAVGDVKITKGLTLHCDITLSNNLEINWPDHKWHLDKPITKATCIDDPAIDPTQPPAPFDTFIGEAIGRLDGVDGALIKFTFVDAGEPGGKADKAGFQIWDKDGNLVLSLPLQLTTTGNLQAHYDQPHGSKP